MKSNASDIGRLYVVGIGPGGAEHLTPAAAAALEAADTVVGYRTYLDLIAPYLAGREVVASGMRQEVDRCREAVRLAAAGRCVALVSGGDAGIYGMAGLALELAGTDGPEVEIVPAVSAVQAAAARLGAPLMHDFAVISLSDLLTPLPLIRRRLDAAAAADFVVVLYNPRSKGRPDHLDTARRILLRHRGADTPVGIVRHATRPEESVQIATLADFDAESVDMFSLVIIGNSQTVIDGKGRMLTPRGYGNRYEVSAPPLEKPGGILSSQPGAKPPSSPFAKGGSLTLFNDGISDEISAPPFAKGGSKALFVGGTGSDVGKSLVTAGLCRLLARRGVSVAPFKAQNMALNSAVTPDGGEIGRAQALQAAACGLEPHIDMNPVLLKPNSQTGSQVIVNGRPVGTMEVKAYHAYKPQALTAVGAAYRRLASRHQVIVIEGAGSIAEINLRDQEIVNLRMAELAEAPVLLVADIDRGGVFAAIVGTLALLDASQRARVKGVIINRFRGDATLLNSGIREVEERTGVPVLGVVPWIELQLPEEDSLALNRKRTSPGDSLLQIGVIRLPRISNYSDFDPLEHQPGVDLFYIDRPEAIADCDLVLLPGSKSTLADLAWLQENGFAAALLAYHAGGGRVVGICGGYQMLGTTLADPQHLESERSESAGLGLLDIATTLLADKQTHQVTFATLPAAADCGVAAAGSHNGYEIHLGETVPGPAATPLFSLTRRDGSTIADGARSADGRVFGTYLHGLFDNEWLRRNLLETLAAAKGVQLPAAAATPTLHSELDRLADHLAGHLDLKVIFALLGLEEGR